MSAVPVIAIVGAGASHTCSPETDHLPKERPPLTRGLFASELAQRLAPQYGLAQSAGWAIEENMTGSDPEAFEQALRGLLESANRDEVQMAAAVPFFLQALMLGYSAQLATKSRRYSSLVRHLFRLPAGRHFVSLNYDLLLDIQLAQRFSLDTLDDYLGIDEDWSLIKPHGSAAWYVPQRRKSTPAPRLETSRLNLVPSWPPRWVTDPFRRSQGSEGSDGPEARC